MSFSSSSGSSVAVFQAYGKTIPQLLFDVASSDLSLITQHPDTIVKAIPLHVHVLQV